ncbi:LysE family translocator [Rubrimonas sp.]|uniref:LysE family translocator n=1 Tax=Rubrimonas sp. TaxID=2036015 RepID=UPI002FDE0ED3
MTLETWLAFVAASSVLLVMPGPTVLLIVSYAMGGGFRVAAPMAFGVALGDFTAMTLSLLGVGAVLAASATAFTALKLGGAAYLVWLGVKLWREGGALEATPLRNAAPAWSMFKHAWLVTTLNPKTIMFFVAFLPQFFDPARDYWVQMAIFEATFVTLAFLNVFAYAALAGRARTLLRSERALTIVNRTAAGALIGAGVASAFVRRA